MGLFKTTSEKISEFFSSRWGVDDDDSKLFSRQKILAFAFAMLFSLSLWVIVNMGRDYNVTMMVPIEVTNLPEDVALSSEVPDNAAVSISGEGWSLFNLYMNPPKLSLNVENQQINMFEQVRQQIGSVSDVNVMQVDPMFLEVETEQRISKMVPVVSRINISTRDQYGVIGSPEISPDSVMVSGPASKIEDINSWGTAESEYQNVNSELDLTVDLQEPPPGIVIRPSAVSFNADVAEFTEAEVRIPVRSRGLPPGNAITFSPSSIMVRYDVPLDQYNEVQNMRPFVAYVDYESIEQDTTGLITPRLEKVTDEYDVRLRSFQPTRVSYYNILPE